MIKLQEICQPQHCREKIVAVCLSLKEEQTMNWEGMQLNWMVVITTTEVGIVTAKRKGWRDEKSISGEGTLLATGSYDGQARIWTTNGGYKFYYKSAAGVCSRTVVISVLREYLEQLANSYLD
ncbi:hypothetical protein V8G54_001131 [Vigna mungo]|uniref:Uncharacterized protein n=1 Tax=Vigna mungo TaxID=3915 RepID=A0AAQ3P864_VIGMU